MFFPLVLLRGGCAGHKTLGGPLHHAQNTGKGRRQERRAPQPNVGRTLCAGHTRPVKNPAVLYQAALAEGAGARTSSTSSSSSMRSHIIM